MTLVLVLSVRLMLSKPWIKQSISCSQQQTKSLWWRCLSPLWHPSGVWGWTAHLQSCIWPVFRSGGHGRNQSVWPRIYILKSVGARKQPCFAPFVIRKASDSSLSSRNLTVMQTWNCWTIVMVLLRQPEFSIIFHKPSLLTVSKALVRSTKVTKLNGGYSAFGIFPGTGVQRISCRQFHILSGNHTGFLGGVPAQNVEWRGSAEWGPRFCQ